ncbi:Tn3 family transposase [Microcoleus sp. herbarium19]|uniref:Tn3 family transposase n=1 Tax=unclassified Microcoleus TaxID=2642155 RepID=UPI002FD12F55
MASIERTAYPRFKRYFTPKELREVYTPTPAEIAFGLSTTQGQVHFLNLMVLLKTFQRLGYFPKLTDIPKSLVNHIRTSLSLPENIYVGYEQSRTMYRHRTAIREYLNVTHFNQSARHLAVTTVYKSASVMDNPADLINVAIDELIHQRYELPGFNTLDRLVRRVRNLVNQKLFSLVLSRLSQEYIQRLDNLLDSHPVQHRSPYNDLKQLPKRPTRNHLNDLLTHLIWLDSFGEVKPYLESITEAKIQHFAGEAKALDAAEVKDIGQNKRITLLLCLIYSAQVQARDNLVSMFLKRMRIIHNKAKEELERLRQKHLETTEKLVGVLTNVLQVFVDKPTDTEVIAQVQNVFTPAGGVQQLLNECEAVNAYSGNNYLPLIWRFYKSHRSGFFRLINALKFSSTSQDEILIKALDFLLSNAHRRGEWLPATVDLSFASYQWQRLILGRLEQPTQMIRRHFEVCIFSYLATELRSGDVCIFGSADYADYREQLLSWEECQPLVATYCKNLGFSNTASSFVKQLQSWLIDTATSVDAGAPDNRAVVINELGEPVLKRPKSSELSSSVKALESAIAERMPERNLIDVLRNVDYWTNFTRHFGPISGSDPKLERATERYLLTTFAYGCNLGPTQAARHMRGIVTPRVLSFVNRRHVSGEKLNAALTDVINRYNVLNLPKLWGDGSAAAADGTKYDLYEQNLLSEYHIRYGGYGGIAYHHVADSYVALFSHFIPCGTWEAVYIIDGLLKNQSDIQPERIHADTQGQSTPVFALSYLLGIQLMPRIRNWQDLIFYRPSKSAVYQHIDLLFKDSIDWSRIANHWNDLLRVVLSIQTGKISSSILLRKLGNYSRKNRLYQAFQELGRVVRTVFLLRYISDMQLRQQITAVTNKVEAYHGFSKWFFFGGEGVIANNDPEEQEKIIKYNDLIANAVVFHNAVDLTDVLRQLKREGYLVVRNDVAALSPYLTSHIKRFGDYLIDLDAVPQELDEEMVLTF